jgi:uncharacterized membrane protein
MTNSFSNRSMIAAAFMAASLASLISVGSAKAGTAGNLHQCDSNNRSSTVQCCESLIRNDQADWLRNSGRGCRAATTCASYFGRYRCYVKREREVLIIEDNQGKGNRSSGGGQPAGRGNGIKG